MLEESEGQKRLKNIYNNLFSEYNPFLFLLRLPSSASARYGDSRTPSAMVDFICKGILGNYII